MFFGVSLAMHLFAGPATVKFDKRKLLIIVYIIGAIANLGYAMFHSIPAFIAFRVLSGVQYSFFGSIIITLAGDHLPKVKLAYGLGLYGIGGAIGNAIAPTIGAEVLRIATERRGESFGFTALFLLGSFILAMATIPAIALSPDKKTKEDIIQAGVWYKNVISVQALPSAAVLFLLMIPYALINTYMFEFGKEQMIAGISTFYMVFAATLAVSRPVSGYLTDRLGLSKVSFPALVIFAFALFFIGLSDTLGMVLIGAVISALGFGAAQPALQSMCIQSETAVRRGVAGNTAYIGIDLGLFLGPYLGGLVYAKTDYPVMYKTGVLPIVLSGICLMIALPMYRRRLKELER